MTDVTGQQTMFGPETREQRIGRWEELGIIDPNCTTCREQYQHPTLSAMMPPHTASTRCLSGKHKHCSCDICF